MRSTGNGASSTFMSTQLGSISRALAQLDAIPSRGMGEYFLSGILVLGGISLLGLLYSLSLKFGQGVAGPTLTQVLFRHTHQLPGGREFLTKTCPPCAIRRFEPTPAVG